MNATLIRKHLSRSYTLECRQLTELMVDRGIDFAIAVENTGTKTPLYKNMFNSLLFP